ncbi:hypothetical protein AAFA46_02870 [Oscillospiraceae bacterium WX1]
MASKGKNQQDMNSNNQQTPQQNRSVNQTGMNQQQQQKKNPNAK